MGDAARPAAAQNQTDFRPSCRVNILVSCAFLSTGTIGGRKNQECKKEYGCLRKCFHR
jgi:hypothetical protein